MDVCRSKKSVCKAVGLVDLYVLYVCMNVSSDPQLILDIFPWTRIGWTTDNTLNNILSPVPNSTFLQTICDTLFLLDLPTQILPDIIFDNWLNLDSSDLRGGCYIPVNVP